MTNTLGEKCMREDIISSLVVLELSRDREFVSSNPWAYSFIIYGHI